MITVHLIRLFDFKSIWHDVFLHVHPAHSHPRKIALGTSLEKTKDQKQKKGIREGEIHMSML